MDEMRAEFEAQKATTRTSLREMWTNPCLKSPLIIAVMMQLAQQLSGINAVSIRYKTLTFLKQNPHKKFLNRIFQKPQNFNFPVYDRHKSWREYTVQIYHTRDG